MEFIVSENFVRIGVFVTVFATMAIFELWSPRLEREELRGAYRSRRWLTNISLVVISSVAMRVLLPVAAGGAAAYAQNRGWGLFNALHVDPVVAGLLSFVLLDFAIWLEHVASHKIPLLWQIHKMHHADTAIDVTTGLRFHPFEIVLSMLWKMLIVIVLGPPVVAVLVFEVVLNATSMFNHSNVRLPLRADMLIRRFLVTPDMHRVHHSTISDETDSNYGFNLPIWDKMFKTYVDQPRLGHEAIEIGLKEYRDERPSGLLWSLALPLRRK